MSEPPRGTEPAEAQGAAVSRRTILTAGAAAGAVASLGREAAAAPPHTIPAAGYAAPSASGPLTNFDFVRRPVGSRDVLIDILYCGVCHSDIHTVRSEWGGTVYPCVPGHEILGRVVRAGKAVSRFRPGDIVAVGCMVNSCGECDNCRDGAEQYCERGAVWTYNSPDRELGMGTPTYGGYSTLVVVTEKFVVRVPAGMDPARTAPLLCAGITTYSPLRHWHAGPGKRVGIIGIGGLGHVGVKISAALGAETYAFTSSPGKLGDAGRLGAAGAFLSTDEATLRTQRRKFDLLIDTIPHAHDVRRYLPLLRRDGTLVIVGAIGPATSKLYNWDLVSRRLELAGSCIGGVAETQEVLDFCASHRIAADVEIIPMNRINEAMDRVVARDVRYRFVIDMASMNRA